MLMRNITGNNRVVYVHFLAGFIKSVLRPSNVEQKTLHISLTYTIVIVIQVHYFILLAGTFAITLNAH